jgi:hypothetical protein
MLREAPRLSMSENSVMRKTFVLGHTKEDAIGRDKRQALINMLIKLQVQQNAGNFLSI